MLGHIFPYSVRLVCSCWGLSRKPTQRWKMLPSRSGLKNTSPTSHPLQVNFGLLWRCKWCLPSYGFPAFFKVQCWDGFGDENQDAALSGSIMFGVLELYWGFFLYGYILYMYFLIKYVLWYIRKNKKIYRYNIWSSTVQYKIKQYQIIFWQNTK